MMQVFINYYYEYFVLLLLLLFYTYGRKKQKTSDNNKETSSVCLFVCTRGPPGSYKSPLEHTSRVHTFAFTLHYIIRDEAVRFLPNPLPVWPGFFFFRQLLYKLNCVNFKVLGTFLQPPSLS